MNLNPKKCFWIHYTPKNFKSPLSPHYSINNTPIEQKEKVVDLGITISQDLKFHGHIDNICEKAKREINRVRRSFKCRTPDFLANVYKTHIRPTIEYAEPVWNPVYRGDSDKLEKVQNKLTKLLKHGSVMRPDERNQMLGLTDHKTRRLRGDLIHLFKASLANQLNLVDRHSKRRFNTRAIARTSCRTNIRTHSFIIRNTEIWNSLPEDIVSSESVNEFKSKIDEYLNAVRPNDNEIIPA